MLSADIGFEGAWNLLRNIVSDPPNLYTGRIVDDTRLFLNRLIANQYWLFPEVRTLGGSQNCAMDEYVGWQVSAKNNGAWFYPGGSVATPPEL